MLGTHATQAADLYATEVQVMDESPEERSKGLTAALAVVIKKVSDDPKVTEQPKVAKALLNASSMMQQFRYRIELGEAKTADKKPSKTRYLWARFDKTSVDNLLQQANIHVWAQNRPKILLWLAVEQQGQRRLFNLSEAPESYTAVQSTAKSRGIPLQLPLLDLEDQAKLPVADLWASYESSIRSASERYPHDVILVGRLRQMNEQLWSADWSLFGQRDKHDFSANNVTLPQAFTQSLNDTQDYLAAKYAPKNTSVVSAIENNDGVLSVRFTGIDTLRAYSRLMSIVKRQNEINRFKLRQIKGDAVLFEVVGAQAGLVQSLESTGQLIPIQTASTPDEPVDLVYRLSK